MCEIRFSVSSKDGKLEGMLNAIPSNIKTEVAKEALRYFLTHVRDKKVESNYIDAELLSQFRVDVEKNSFSVEDVMKILTSQQTFSNQPQYIVEHPAVAQNSTPVLDDIQEDEDEYDLDLSKNEFGDTKESSVSMSNIDFDDMDF